MRTAVRGHDGVGRAAVLGVLRDAAGELTLADLSARTGLSPSTTRFHLDHLVDAGVVRVRRRAPGRPGRPALLYRAVPSEAVDGGAAYRLLAGLLADELVRVGGTDASREAGRRWAVRAASRAGLDRAADPVAPDAAAHAVAAFFDDAGFAPEVAGPGAVLLHRCPFLDLARDRSAAVCTVHAGLLEGLLDALGSDRRPRLEAVLDGSGPCVVRLTPPPTGRPR